MRFFLKNLANLFLPFEVVEQQVPTKRDQEKCFLYFAGELVTIVINQKNQQTAEHLTQVLRQLSVKYRFSFSHLLVEAEKNNQPKRLSLLKQVWFDSLKE